MKRERRVGDLGGDDILVVADFLYAGILTGCL